MKKTTISISRETAEALLRLKGSVLCGGDCETYDQIIQALLRAVPQDLTRPRPVVIGSDFDFRVYSLILSGFNTVEALDGMLRVGYGRVYDAIDRLVHRKLIYSRRRGSEIRYYPR